MTKPYRYTIPKLAPFPQEAQGLLRLIRKEVPCPENPAQTAGPNSPFCFMLSVDGRLKSHCPLGMLPDALARLPLGFGDFNNPTRYRWAAVNSFACWFDSHNAPGQGILLHEFIWRPGKEMPDRVWKRNNLRRLRNYLIQLILKPGCVSPCKFDMCDFATHGQGRLPDRGLSPWEWERHPYRRTACAAGHAPFAGVKPMEGEMWNRYVNRTMCDPKNHRNYRALFGAAWSAYDNSMLGAIQRIQYVLQNGDLEGNEMWTSNDDEDFASECAALTPYIGSIPEDS